MSMPRALGNFQWMGRHMWKWTRNNAVIGWKFAKVEMKPPRIDEWPVIRQGFRNLANGLRTRAWRGFTVKEAWLNTLIAIEVSMWFWFGELIGKRRFYGYYVKPTTMRMDGGVPFGELGEKPAVPKGATTKIFGAPPVFPQNIPGEPGYKPREVPPKESMDHKLEHL